MVYETHIRSFASGPQLDYALIAHIGYGSYAHHMDNMHMPVLNVDPSAALASSPLLILRLF